jgi:hypothetical protein
MFDAFLFSHQFLRFYASVYASDKFFANATMSPKTPAAVTAAPAPGPRTINGVDPPVGP